MPSPGRWGDGGWSRTRTHSGAAREDDIFSAIDLPEEAGRLEPMSAESKLEKTGGCLCGGVRYRVKGPLRPVVYCHCSQCRRTSGHFVAVTAVAKDALVVVADKSLDWFTSSDVASRGFCKRCREAGVVPSMGSTGDAYDNAMAESFFATLEREVIDRRRFRSRSEARMAIFSWLEGWYNPHRRHSALGYLSPTNYERKMLSRAA